MNYRHAFHAGNFADVVKHAALLQLLARRKGPISVVDTHAGAGLYDLGGPEAQRSGEAAEGVLRLMSAPDAPDVFTPLVEAVRAANRQGGVRIYPGSPALIAKAMRPGDRYLACELRPEEHRALDEALRGAQGAEARCADGYEAVKDHRAGGAQELVLIDPPFERPDDYRRAVDAVGAIIRRNRQATVMVWTPLKDLETLDAFVRDLEDGVATPVTVAETRIRPLRDPMKMNGCVLAVLGAPEAFAATLEEICSWVAEGFGKDGVARIWTTA